jgi:exoribonuclease R
MKISGVLQLKNRTLYGMTARHVPMYLFTPLNRDYPPMTVASTERDKSQNKLALVEPIAEEKEGVLRRGALCGFIGNCGDPVAERKAIHLAYSPVGWKNFPMIIEPADHDIVLDVPTTINIDPPGCVDIDDCISIWEEDGITKVAITIADVGEWVLSNPWMMFAEHMGQTLYDEHGGIVRSLFPHEYRMSLIPGQKRLGIALMFDWVDKAPVNLRFREVTIFNKTKHTYDSIYTATDFPVATLREICNVISGGDYDDSHKWVETLMMFYNISLAKHLMATGRGGILRAHDAPAHEKMIKYARIGLPGHLAMSSARYVDASSCEEHYAIKSVYCHGSSPIRRWVDVVNQLCLKDRCPGADIDMCNTLQSYGKQHQRDRALLSITEKYAGVSVGGVVVSGTRVWVPDWNRMISVMNECEEGTSVRIDFHVDMNKPTWKQRVVFRCS